MKVTLKKNKAQTLLWWAANAAMLAACSVFGSPATPTPDPARDWAGPIQTAAALQPNNIPDHLLQSTPQPQSTDFDPNQYFTAFTHLTMEPGYVLDYTYQYDGMGGFPFLFARRLENDPVQPGEALPYLEHIQTDGTEMGYYELTALSIMAGQFYLYWHANYNDIVVVPDNQSLEAIINNATSGSMGQPMDNATVRDARALTLTPLVTFQGDTATVKLITYSNFSGFSERTVVFAKDFPHTVINSQSTVVVPYNWNIVY